MPLLEFNSDSDEKEIKDIINKNIASSIKTQDSFADLLELNGCPSIKLGSIGGKIRRQLLREAKKGYLTVNNVMPRAYELIGVYLEINHVRTFDDRDNYKINSILEDGFDAELPYIASGAELGWAGANAFGGVSYFSSNVGEGRTKWKSTRVFFEEDGLKIAETGQFIFYKHVDRVSYSQNFDKKVLIESKINDIAFIMKNGEQFIMRVKADEFNVIKHCIDMDIKETNAVSSDDNDILIKYFEMLEKGLITREEFDLKKKEIYVDNSLLNQDSVQESYCSNCGTKLVRNSNFCHNCGNTVN